MMAVRTVRNVSIWNQSKKDFVPANSCWCIHAISYKFEFNDQLHQFIAIFEPQHAKMHQCPWAPLFKKFSIQMRSGRVKFKFGKRWSIKRNSHNFTENEMFIALISIRHLSSADYMRNFDTDLFRLFVEHSSKHVNNPTPKMSHIFILLPFEICYRPLSGDKLCA